MLARDEALALLKKSNPAPHLFQHALASEAVLRALARHFQENEDIWGLTGLLHDLDYPQTESQPEKHGMLAPEMIGTGLPEESLQAIRAHNAEYTGIKPASRLDYALRCGESVTGLLVTAALVRPTKLEGMKISSLKKKMKDKAFAASVNRESIRECSQLGLELDDFLTLATEAMRAIAEELGLKN